MKFKLGDKVIDQDTGREGAVTSVTNKFPRCPITVTYLIPREYAYMKDGRDHPTGNIVLIKKIGR